MDYIPGEGVEIRAVADGYVTDSGVLGSSGAYGEAVFVDHGAGWQSRYGHMLVNTRVSAGQYVSRGQYLGRVGNTGNSFGAHLHLEIRLNGAVQDPLPLVHNAPLAGGSEPLRAVREISVNNGSWVATPVGHNLATSVFSAVNQGSGWGDVYASEGGYLKLVGVVGGSWTKMNSGLPLNATSMTALNVGQTFPQILAVEDGLLKHVYADSAGWHNANTGIPISGRLSAAVLPGNSVQAMSLEGGNLYHITSHSGWQRGGTGVQAGDEFEAVVVGGTLQVMTVLNNQVQQIYPGSGWIRSSTGVYGGGTLTAVDMGGGWPTVVTNEGWNVVVTSVINGSWSRNAMGLVTSGRIDAVNLGGGSPVLYAV